MVEVVDAAVECGYNYLSRGSGIKIGEKKKLLQMPFLELYHVYILSSLGKKVSLAAICLVAGSASFGLREN